MTDLATDEAPLSTVIDTEPGPSAAGGGTPSLTEPAEQQPPPKESVRDSLEAAFRADDSKKEEKKEAKGDEPKPEQKAETKPEKSAAPEKKDAKAEAEPKEAPKDDAKAAAEPAETKEAAPKEEAKPEEAKEFRGPPKRFLPDSHEVWRNVPRSVRRDIEVMEREHEEERQRFQEVSQRYDRIRDFDELARSNGRDLREILAQVHQFENLMRQNPIAALNMALMQVGPRKADGQPFSLYDIAQHIAQQGPEGYQRMVAQPAPQPQPQPARESEEMQAIRQELAELKVSRIEADVIEPFKAKHPRYDELQQDIAFFLKSGRIPQSLSLTERLAAAYDMAVRINPSSHAATPAASNDPGPGADRRADPEDFSGSKSIKSSPGSVTEDVSDMAKSGESTRDSLLAEMRRLRR
ncbi:hypothetical protein LZK98_11870 [Sphingomonas cannabina]|uniref:hypothetical protein n=1 Tax=Sphingomonas cannabina TaxID=2899123 RepID=UPI001F346802|nr:hypothetical protein [Sphingomonas cannabina]UIJ43789.1 hypothetical protein LZK98_11870 [Sphingomonas cannabina]